MKIATKRSKSRFHVSYASESGAHEGTGVSPRVPDVPTYGFDDDRISWKSSDDEDDDDAVNQADGDEDDDDADNQGDDAQDDDNKQTESDNDGDNFVHPKLSTFDEEERHNEKQDEEEEGSDLRVQTPSHFESTDDKAYDVVTQGDNVEEEKLDEDKTNEEDVDELYSDENINLEGTDTDMTDASLANVQATQVIEDTHVLMTDVLLKFNSKVLMYHQALSPTCTTLIRYSRTDLEKKLKLKMKTSSINLMKNKEDHQGASQSTSKGIAKTSHGVAANLSELELKKILIDKVENTVMIKRCRDDEDDDKEPSAISKRRSNRRRARKEPESTSKPKEKTSKSTSKSKEGSKSHQKSTSNSAQAEEPIHTTEDLEEHAPQEFNTVFSEDQPIEEASQLPDCNLAWKEDTHDSFNELMDTPLDFSAFMMNRLKVDTLTLKLLVGLTFELMKGSCKTLVELEYFLEEPLPLIPNSQGRRVIPFDHFINNDLAYLRGGVSSQTYATLVTKTKAVNYGHIKWIEDLVSNTMNRIIVVTKLQIDEWHNYKHLDWITVRRNDNKLYTFKEGYYKRLRLQDIEDMLLLLVHGKLTNLTIKECLAMNVSLRMFTRSIVIQKNLKRLPTYLAYPNPRGFIYQNKDKNKKLMCIDELYKFSDGTLNDVRTTLDDILKRIKMKYLPQTYWRNVDKERAGAMIQALDKQLKNRRIMRSMEKFIGGRPYEGDFRLLERTI
nr:hypothetical protein [Tanacetum cinerariifolium]